MIDREALRAKLARHDEKLVIGYVTAGDPRSKFVDSLDRYRTVDMFLGVQRLNDPWRIAVRSGANISRARNELVATFLNMPGEPPWLWLVDDDMVFAPDAVEGLLKVATETRVVGGLCFSFGAEGISPTMFVHDTDGRVVRWPAEWPIPERTVQPVAGTGAACLLMHREILVRIGEKSRSPHAWFREHEYEVPDGSLQWISEDLYFCRQVYEAGGEVCVHTGVEVGHIKPVLIGKRLFEQQQAGQVVLEMG